MHNTKPVSLLFVFCLPGSHHVVPKGASHHGLGLLAEMEAVSTEEGAIRTTILRR